MADYPETVIYTEKDRVWCMGEDLDHPKVYYSLPEEGFTRCNYCDIIYTRDKKFAKEKGLKL
jgi:uncharacterized Zn-finger protein|tara:strand:- start:2280 stop:2465 length:186 start_codon:yes stop_codon:yes gene_type:complete